jgi:UDP-N-acetylglucosamine--N-acetylmuramyl-(pentapeptide) pyrophosphoryl-undecaprenol N-acetylglucosamine transferase
MNKHYRIVLTGGGTGGHLFPLLPVAKELRARLGDQTEILYFGPAGDMEQKIIGEAGIASIRILSGKWRRYFDLRNISDAFKNIIGFFQSLYHLYHHMPDAVFSKGAYAAVPVVLAAWVYRIPILTQDSDATPGVANKIMGKFADRIAVAYPSAVRYFEASRVAITGNPVRDGITLGNAERARGRFGCPPEKPALLILGGSLGSRAMNLAILKILPRLLARFFVIHQTGSGNHEEVLRRIEELSLGDLTGKMHTVPFLDIGELSDALALADLVVSRAGANAITDIAAVGKPAILIPLPSAANDEQRMNAYEIARVGGALVLEEGNLGEHMLSGKIEELMNDAPLRAKMANALRAFHHPDAAKRLAEGVVALIRFREEHQTVLDRTFLWIRTHILKKQA